jgi:drug/metabolite transporter (DMT)-like permease
MTVFKTLALSALCAFAFSLCDTLAAHWAKNGSRTALAGAIVLGPIGYIIFGYINTRVDLAVAGGLVNALIVVFTALAGIFLFRETQLSSAQITGLAFILIGVILVVK